MFPLPGGRGNAWNGGVSRDSKSRILLVAIIRVEKAKWRINPG